MKSRSLVLFWALLFSIILSSGSAQAGLVGSTEPKMDSSQLISALKSGGYVVYFRHAATEKFGEKSVDASKLSDCSVQRNLSAEGRGMSKDIGAGFKAHGIPVGDVYSSPYCRCVDTAELAFGKHRKSDDLHFSIHLPKDRRSEASEGLRKMFAEKPKRSSNTIIVSHTGNLKSAVGIWPKKEGEANVFKPVGGGDYEYLGKILPDEWN